MEVCIELPVRAYDVDFQGVVNNLVYVRWLEDLRFALLGRYMPLAEQVGKGFAPILASTQIEYKSPIRFGDRVVGRVWATEARHVRCAVRCEIWAGDRLAAAATQTGCFVDLATLRPIALPEPLRREFRRQSGAE